MLLMGLIRETSFDEEQISRFAVHKDSKTLIVCSLFPKRAGNPCQQGNWALQTLPGFSKENNVAKCSGMSTSQDQDLKL